MGTTERATGSPITHSPIVNQGPCCFVVFPEARNVLLLFHGSDFAFRQYLDVNCFVIAPSRSSRIEYTLS